MLCCSFCDVIFICFSPYFVNIHYLIRQFHFAKFCLTTQATLVTLQVSPASCRRGFTVGVFVAGKQSTDITQWSLLLTFTAKIRYFYMLLLLIIFTGYWVWDDFTIADAVLSTDGFSTVSKKTIHQAITSAFKNSCDWYGGRSMRAKRSLQLEEAENLNLRPHDKDLNIARPQDKDFNIARSQNKDLNIARPQIKQEMNTEL